MKLSNKLKIHSSIKSLYQYICRRLLNKFSSDPIMLFGSELLVDFPTVF
jgi:hypothetical protein